MNKTLIARLAPLCTFNPNDPENLEPEYVMDLKGCLEIMSEELSGVISMDDLKKIPWGCILMNATGDLSTEELVTLTEKDVLATGMYPMHKETDSECFDDFQKAQNVLWEMFSSGEYLMYNSSEEIKWELPPVGELTALNTILGTTSLPTVERIVNFGKNAQTRIDAGHEEITRLFGEIKGKEDDLERLQKALRQASIDSGPATMELPSTHSGEIPSGKTKQVKASEVFKMKFENDFLVTAFEWDGDHPHVPKVDTNYVFREDILTRALYALNQNKKCYIQGHTGSGKTTLVEQVCALLGMPFFKINFDSEITRMDLIGRDTLTEEDGVTVSKFIHGILPVAMQSPGVICFDEIDFVRPDVAYVLQSVLEGGMLRIPENGDEVVLPHVMNRMVATGNTVGQGDEHGMYQGARPQSLAFLDRFTIWIRVDYLSKTQRKKLVKNHQPMLSTDDAKMLNNYTEEHLTAFTQGNVHQPISPRGMMAIADATVSFGSLKEALKMVVLDRATDTDRATLMGIVDRTCK